MPQEIISLEESRRLAELEAVIASGVRSFIKVGEALSEIRATYLNRFPDIGYLDFPDYCLKKWGMSANYARRVASAAEVMDNVKSVPIGTLPKTEAQVRPLTTLPSEQQQQAWTRAVESANGSQPTAKQVEAAVQEVRSETEIPKREPAFQPSNGMQYANLAIDNLRKIQPNDTERDKAFMAVQRFITQNYQAK